MISLIQSVRVLVHIEQLCLRQLIKTNLGLTLDQTCTVEMQFVVWRPVCLSYSMNLSESVV